MAPQPSNGNPPMTAHPLVRQFLITLVQIGLPIAEAVLVQWLTSKGFKLPPLSLAHENANQSRDPGNPPAGSAGAGSAGAVSEPPASGA